MEYTVSHTEMSRVRDCATPTGTFLACDEEQLCPTLPVRLGTSETWLNLLIIIHEI